MRLLNKIILVLQFIRYNIKVVFGNKFVYFLIAAFIFFFMVIGIMLFTNSNPLAEDIYWTLIFPGILILFYPVIFNIQNDKDARMLEIVFAIPNYRYTVYLLRFAITIGMLIALLVVMSWLSIFAIVHFPVFKMIYQLMFPLLFLSCVSFLFATLVKNANGAAVIVVIIGLFFLILADELEYSKWNIFLNPFNVPTDMSQSVWRNVMYQNRMMLIITSAVSLLWSLINLQRREKFV